MVRIWINTTFPVFSNIGHNFSQVRFVGNQFKTITIMYLSPSDYKTSQCVQDHKTWPFYRTPQIITLFIFSPSSYSCFALQFHHGTLFLQTDSFACYLNGHSSSLFHDKPALIILPNIIFLYRVFGQSFSEKFDPNAISGAIMVMIPEKNHR